MKLVMNYANADQKFLKTVTVYAKKNDNFIYADSACTQKIDKETMTELCAKGLAVVSYEKAFYPVAAFKENTAKKCLDVTIYDVLANTAAAVTVHTGEYTA